MFYLQWILWQCDSDIRGDDEKESQEKHVSSAISLLQKDWEIPVDRIDRTLSLIQLNLCIRNYKNYYEAYIYRGKLYLKLKHYKKALADFDQAIHIDGHKQIAFVGKGDCLRLMEKYD